MAIDLRDRGPKALADPVLQRLDQLSLPLEVLNFAEMQANLDELDERVQLLERLLNLAGLEELQDVALLHVGVALEHDAALLAGVDLLDVVLEAPQ